MKHFFGKLHLWLSVPFGLLVTCICLSGALLVFESEIEGLVQPEFRHLDKPAHAAPLPLDSILDRVAASLPADVTVTGVEISPDASAPYKVNISKPRRASVIVNQYSGQTIGRSEKLPFFADVTRLHRRFFDKAMTADGNPSPGKLLVGVSTMIFVLVLITGILIWWPASRKALSASLKPVNGHGARRFWFWAHEAWGMYAVILILAIALTGLTWSFKWYAGGFYSLLGAPAPAAPAERSHGADTSKAPRAVDFSAWQSAYAEVAAKNPGKRITVSGKAVNVALGGWGNCRAADVYRFNPQGKVTEITPYAETPAYDRARGWVYSIHAGLWGGLFSKIINFLAALAGASLPLTGYYLWFSRLKAGHRRRMH